MSLFTSEVASLHTRTLTLPAKTNKILRVFVLYNFDAARKTRQILHKP